MTPAPNDALAHRRCPRAFLVTVDTEGDDLWSRPHEIRTRNTASLPRFQHLCEAYGLKPTWLVNYEMALDDAFVRFGRDAARRGTAEIGMHLHAWNTPPLVPLTDDDFRHQPYVTDYPAAVMEEKLHVMTDLLRERFEEPVTSHRGGRWAMDAAYARALAERGYTVDCSVSPTVSWTDMPGDPEGPGGPDYRRFPDRPYFVDLAHIDREGDSPLLELPVSVIRSRLHRWAPWSYRTPGLRRWAWRYAPDRLWLYPDGGNRRELLAVLEEALARRRPYLELVIHSSELMPGGSPHAPDADSIERLYADLRVLFRAATRHFAGMTLAEFRQAWTSTHRTRAPQAAPFLQGAHA